MNWKYLIWFSCACGLACEAQQVRVQTVEELLQTRDNRRTNEALEVVLKAGDYVLPKSLSFTHKDSHTIWRGEGHVRFLSGMKLDKNRFVPVRDAHILKRLPQSVRSRVRVADVSPEKPKGGFAPLENRFLGSGRGPFLFMNHRLCTLARWPNEGWASFTKVLDSGLPTNHTTSIVANSYSQPPAFIYPGERAKRWHYEEGVWLNGYFAVDWYSQCVRVKSYGLEQDQAHVMRLATWIPYGMRVHESQGNLLERRFYAFNLLDELDDPQEWYLDRTHNLLYICQDLDQIEELVLANNDETLLTFSQVNDFTFENISLEYHAGGAVEVKDSENIHFKGGHFSRIAGDVFHIEGKNCSIRDMEISYCGQGAIFLKGGDRKTLTRGNSRIEGCHIHHLGQLQKSGSLAINLGGCGNFARCNVIHDTPHTAVAMSGNECLFEYNEVFRAVTETHDAGAYYAGRDWCTQGNILRYNYTHHIGKGFQPKGGEVTIGFYFDDVDCGDEVYGNIFTDMELGVKIGGGRDHPVRNNIFYRCHSGVWMDNRGMGKNSLIITNLNASTVFEHCNAFNLRERAKKEWNFDRGVWAFQYPSLAHYMDAPVQSAPLNNPIENNLFIDCVNWFALGSTAEWIAYAAPVRGNMVINRFDDEKCPINTNQLKRVRQHFPSGCTVFKGTKVAPFDPGFCNLEKADFRLKEDGFVKNNVHRFRPLPEKIANPQKRRKIRHAGCCDL